MSSKSKLNLKTTFWQYQAFLNRKFLIAAAIFCVLIVSSFMKSTDRGLEVQPDHSLDLIDSASPLSASYNYL